ncbi:MAG: MFS transporter [Myxococcota bacterium]
MTAPAAPLPARTKLAFGVGATAETLSLFSFGALTMIYYNQVLGLDVRLAGLAPSLAIFFDAISDPFMGSFSDRWKSKRWGRRHPFMFIAPIPIGVAFWCVFNPPSALAGGSLFAWFTCWGIALRTFMTIYHVPHLAMGAELSSDYNERSKVMSYNNFFAWLGAGAMFKVNTTVFFASTGQYANGLLNPQAYSSFSSIIMLVIIAVLFSSAWFTRDQIPRLPKPPEDLPEFSLRDFGRDLRSAFSNRNYLFLMIALFSLSLMLGMRAGMGQYMNIYYWELPAEQIGTLIFAGSMIGYVTGFTMSARIHRRFDKRATIVTTAMTLSIFPALPVLLRMMGSFPGNDSFWLLPGLIAFGALASASGSILSISVMSALADIADENELEYGLRQEGILYAARTFFAKLDSSLGHLVAAFALYMISFPDKAVPGEIEIDTLWWLGLVDSPLSILPGVIAACFYAGYRINKRKYEETRRALEARKAAGAPAAEAATELPGA